MSGRSRRHRGKAQRWRTLDEAVPDRHDRTFLVWTKGKNMMLALYQPELPNPWRTMSGLPLDRITHWRYAPEPPTPSTEPAQ